MSYRCEQIHGWEALAGLADRWTELCARSAVNTVFQTFEWHESWWRCFGAGHDLLVLVARDGAEVRAIAPLMISRERHGPLRRRVLRFIGSSNHASDYCDLIVDRAHPEAAWFLVRWIADHPDWDRLELRNIQARSPHLRLWEEALRGRAVGVRGGRLCEAPARRLGDPQEDRDVLGKKSLRRHLNFFQRGGQITFRHVETAAEIAPLLEPFFQQHIERRALTEAQSLFLDPAQRAFYRDLVRTLLPRGWLRFAVVDFNGEPIAFHFGFEYGGSYVWYKPTFNVKYLKNSPGEVLLRFLLEYAIEQGLAEFDFTVGEEAFKYRFANETRENRQVLGFRSRLEYGAYLAVDGLRRTVRGVQGLVAGRPTSQPPAALALPRGPSRAPVGTARGAEQILPDSPGYPGAAGPSFSIAR